MCCRDPEEQKMKINELISDFEIYVSNEESALLRRMQNIQPMESFTEREQFIIENMIRKSVVTKIVKNNQILVVSNERPQDSR
jgi:hypothetical protein